MRTAIEILEAKIPEIKTRKSDYSVMDIRVMNVLEIMEEYANQSKWISVEKELPEDGEEVIGYSEKWIHPDFNPEGTRVCFINMDEWISAKWNNDQDSWHTHADWCCGDNGGQDFNPTHWQHKPKRP